MSPFLVPLAWLGGRSLDEVRNKPATYCGSSIIIGSFTLLSIGVIGSGQYLYWSHLQHTADNAFWFASGATLLFVFFYRNLIRALEIAGWFGKCLAYLFASVIVGTNALLVGQEADIFIFKPQIEAQTARNAVNDITSYQDTIKNSLGLPTLHNNSSSLNAEFLAAQAERARVPDAVIRLRGLALRCDRVAASLQALIPNESDSPAYALARSTWQKQFVRCQASRVRADRIMHDHLKRADELINDLDDQRSILNKKLSKAGAVYEATLKRDEPSLYAGATSGFARHKALWAAVEAGRVPRWPAIGYMLIFVTFESACFFMKIILPADKATQERLKDVKMERAFLTMHLATIKAYQSQVPSVVKSMKDELANDIKRDLKETIVPGVRTEIRARAFDHAYFGVEEAQRRTGKASNDLLGRLRDLGENVRK